MHIIFTYSTYSTYHDILVILCIFFIFCIFFHIGHITHIMTYWKFAAYVTYVAYFAYATYYLILFLIPVPGFELSSEFSFAIVYERREQAQVLYVIPEFPVSSILGRLPLVPVFILLHICHILQYENRGGVHIRHIPQYCIIFILYILFIFNLLFIS